MKVYFIFSPSHPVVLPLLTHSGLGARPPSCFFSDGGGSRSPGEHKGAQPQRQGRWFRCLYKSVCVQMCLQVEGKLEEGLREEQKQAWAGVNELCQPQPQLHSLYHSFQFEGSRRWRGRSLWRSQPRSQDEAWGWEEQGSLPSLPLEMGPFHYREEGQWGGRAWRG